MSLTVTPSTTWYNLRSFITDQVPADRMILPAWFDHLEDGFSYQEVQSKMFCPPVKISCSLLLKKLMKTLQPVLKILNSRWTTSGPFFA